MPTGKSSFMGRGMGLDGEYQITQQALANDILTLTAASGITGDYFICEDSTGTEVVQIRSDGRMRLSRFATGSNTLDVYFTLTESNASQCYGQTIYFESGGFASAGGRHAVLNLWYAYDGGGGAAHSYINFAAPGASTHPISLFTILNADLDSSLFITSNVSVSRGLMIWVDNVQYTIMLGSAT